MCNNCLAITIPLGWPGMPWFWGLVQLPLEIPQLPVFPTLLKQSNNQEFHNSPQYLSSLVWCLGQRHSKSRVSLLRRQKELLLHSGDQQDTFINQSGASFQKWARENSVEFIKPSIKQLSDLLMHLYQDLDTLPL